MSRRFFDAPDHIRCIWTIKLRDGSEAQCGRRSVPGPQQLCTQHARMDERWSCEYCGGNDEFPRDHCADCDRPTDSIPSQGRRGFCSSYRSSAD